ncbi:ABC transporter ATP-binding protein [Halolamina sp.]|jgi:oligopeptide/dipeptide ABC transporter ATP-binding protein|uniref:ABC transporter ATP-binding protein n=1 Tax=Halolamina sp. TaxID=1940283 RepID=UPI000223B681|nr:oligopeptide/dipeptide ABC transporter, ATPase subunit [halophilic archaeon DL31]
MTDTTPPADAPAHDATDARTDGGDEPLLAVKNLTTRFYTDQTISAVDSVSYELRAGETLGIVGESGSGKSVSVRSVVGLVTEPGRIDAGEVRWKGTDLVGASNRKLRSVRGAEIGMVFQNAEAAFDSTYTVGEQIVEAVTAHRDLSKAEARQEAIDLLEEVGIGDPEGRVDDYPHEYSGGMAQRAMIAMALAGEPELLIADEPTTGLDVSIQAGIIDLFRDLVAEREMSLVLISHDLGVVSQLCERMLVMYGGRVAERGTRRQLLTAPKHPYTRAFLNSIPDVDAKSTAEAIPGSPPNLGDPPEGCRFHPRCAVAEAGLCDHERPPTVAFQAGQEADCYAYTEGYTGEAEYDVAEVTEVRSAEGETQQVEEVSR